MTSTLDLVRSFYAAAAKGDLSTLLGLLHPELDWTEAEGFPYYSGTWRTPAEVAEKLFASLSRDWQDFTIDAQDFITEGDRVVGIGVYSGIYRPTNRSMRAPFAHVWRVADGKIKQFTMYADTLLVHRAVTGVS